MCTSTTRPTNPFEGQMIYETDTDLLRIWNGSAWRTLAFSTPTNGSVLQVVNATYSTETSTTSTSWVTTGLNASITPTSTSSKILILGQVAFSTSGSANNGAVTLFRGTTSGTNLGHSSFGLGLIYSAGGRVDAIQSVMYLDNPSTTSSQTYTVAMNVGAGITLTAQKYDAKSTLTLMEIAG